MNNDKSWDLLFGGSVFAVLCALALSLGGCASTGVRVVQHPLVVVDAR